MFSYFQFIYRIWQKVLGNVPNSGLVSLRFSHVWLQHSFLIQLLKTVVYTTTHQVFSTWSNSLPWTIFKRPFHQGLLKWKSYLISLFYFCAFLYFFGKAMKTSKHISHTRQPKECPLIALSMLEFQKLSFASPQVLTQIISNIWDILHWQTLLMGKESIKVKRFTDGMETETLKLQSCLKMLSYSRTLVV